MIDSVLRNQNAMAWLVYLRKLDEFAYNHAVASSVWAVVMVAVVFGVVTIATMMSIVLVSTFVINLLPTGRLARYSHALAGAAIFLCGVAIHLGL